MSFKKTIFIPFILLPTIFSLLFLPHPVFASQTILWQKISEEGPKEIIKPLSQEVAISALVGQGIFTIEGYSSPNALVFLTNSQGNLSLQTTKTDNNGYFVFKNVLLPANPGELWFQARDQKGNFTTPLAIPQPPMETEKIKDILLPPTFSQTKGQIIAGENAFLWGYGLPNAAVEIYLFKTPAKKWWQIFTGQPALAFEPLKIEIKTDQSGYFEINLPNAARGRYQIFASLKKEGEPSPKSNSLSFQVVGKYEAFWLIFKTLLAQLSHFLKKIVSDLLFWIAIELVILIYLVWKTRQKNKPRIKN
ncbi:carboxypeptidase regulatory-like domain-containing protein [Candidatus Shapirobacteria bacterium]|nr:carboxypeptidase regulatory-like domain-containing protein [Candidatus Shapirobacteria bacterium]